MSIYIWPDVGVSQCSLSRICGPLVYARIVSCRRVQTVRHFSPPASSSPPPLALSRIMAGPRTCIPNNEDNDKSTRRIRPRMCAEYPMHNIASLSSVSPLSLLLLLLHPVHAWISDSTLPRSNYDRARPSPPFPPSLLPRPLFRTGI